MQFKLKQDTNVDKMKVKSFFQLNFPANATQPEIESINELIVKNLTKAKGDLYVEGSQKQVKNLLHKYLVITPACLFDPSI
mmetsp:Transcript_30501/g.46752  ORF Transcript_30501/g.46752 Transcript_30501/m.46752 type:complete len:81 (+) Transcript_30501:148-390(+)